MKIIIADQIYAHLDQEKLLQEEQKGCRKVSGGTNDYQLMITNTTTNK